MIVRGLGLVLASSCAVLPARAGDGLQRAVEFVRAGDFQRALEAGDSDTDPLGRAQARVYVLHHAGDLHGALSAAVEGSRAHPRDTWLLERRAYVAISLRRADEARSALDELDALLAEAPPKDREAWAESTAATRADVERTSRLHAEARTARSRARAVAAVGLALGVALLVATAWPRRHSKSSTPVAPIGSNSVDGGSQ